MSTFININQNSGSNSAFANADYLGQNFVAESTGVNVNSVDDRFGDNPVTVEGIASSVVLQSISVVHANTVNNVSFTMYIFDGFGVHSNSIPSVLLGSVAQNVTGNDGDVLTFDFSGENISLTSGGEYSFAIQRTNDDGFMAIYANDGGNPYANGAHWLSGPIGNFVTVFGNTDITFRIEYQSEETSGAGDPKIVPINGDAYHLPIDDNSYCLLDTCNPDDRLIVNGKCHIRNNKKSYFRYIYIFYNGEEIFIRLPNLHLVDRPDGDNFDECVVNECLPSASSQSYSSDAITEVESNYRIREYHIQTKEYGVVVVSASRNKYKFKIRGRLTELSASGATGCVISEKYARSISSLDFHGVIEK